MQTQYADFALQMGADHKLDLTSEVTHLLVGNANTPKYKYVAREREDVKVLRPEWIEVVRETWMRDDGIDLNALEAQYKLPTFTGLIICITGFDDLSFRAQLQQKIDELGGKYTGDLTKHVTHLIAFKAEGKKYQYAMQWRKHIVTLQWFQDSLQRGMQLDETKYHPTIAPEDQGKGAWNKEAKYANQLGKRSRPQEPVVEPSRKLRRAASAKFSSQNEELWADINSKPTNAQQEREPLRPSKSMPVIRPPTVNSASNGEFVNPPDQMAASFGYENPSRPHRTSELSHGFFDGCYFVLDGFDTRKIAILKGILLGQGGTLLENQKDIENLEHVSVEKCFLVVPHDMGASSATEVTKGRGNCQTVTELWVEICMDKKQYVPSSSYPLGKLLLPLGNLSPNGNSQKFSVNSSGFPGIQRNHVAKAIHAIGATYEEVLKPGVSVLICFSADSSMDKIRHAKEWKVPVVTPGWLWATFEKGALAPFHEYTLDPTRSFEHQEPTKKQVRMHVQTSSSDDRLKGQGPTGFTAEVPTQPLPKKTPHENLAAKERPGSDFLPAQGLMNHYEERASELKGRARVVHARAEHCAESGCEMPLQETTGNSPPKARSLSPKKRKSLFQTLDGADSQPGQDLSGGKAVLLPNQQTRKNSQDSSLLNDAIQDLLNQTARTKSLTSSTLAAQTNKQPLSRALSNISNASMGSRAGASRAGSVSSVNTDGLGSEIATEPTEPGRAASLGRGRVGFTGRAKARDKTQTIQRLASIEASDTELYREMEEEVAPQLTQLGYEDPEEAIALRAKLAEKRRKRSRAGQEEPGTEETRVKARSPPRIRDDDIMLDGKWAGGRRTRHKDRTPPAVKGLNDF
jgi:DNA replication regulator DPB11